MVDHPDGALVRRVLDGDVDAYAILVTRYRDRFARYALHMLGNREDAEEALQDALVRAWRALGRCRDPDRFDAWLFRILANRCRTHGARRRRYEATFVRDEQVLRLAPHDGTAAMQGGPGWDDAVDRALALLEPEQREAFLLKYVDELSYDEMAELTGVGVSALKMRVKRAADRLRGLLEERVHVEQRRKA
jgi:RNA polymerase sigma-70 factor (ECF subfamily)